MKKKSRATPRPTTTVPEARAKPDEAKPVPQPGIPGRALRTEDPTSSLLKRKDLEIFQECADGAVLTTDQGIPISQTDDSLKAGSRGPSLLEDFHLREKITRFDHERIPERVVHARGSGAHGFFRVYESLEDVTCADFLCNPDLRTPVFVRFSTVVGSRGSSDLARDVRGFATKFYTRQGNFDLVGNNMPVFFIQDGIKFPDLVHAVKPEPHNEMPQAASAHDTFWDFVAGVPETLHMVMWVMSDRALPRSYRMMEGFGVHTFRLINARGESVLCKFHWKPVLGAHSIVWEEAQMISGMDPDFHRRDLWDSIESGNYPEYELGLQLIPEDDVLALGFDLLDPTKLVPEELVPVRRVGRLTLNQNPKNFFAETEQVAYCVANVVPGVDFTNDPLMQARLFSYLDTQLTRLGGPNFAEIPINRPLAPVHNHQQDGFGRRTIPTARALYHPNTIEGNLPALGTPAESFRSMPEELRGNKERLRSETFADHYSQARMFLQSQSKPERQHLIDACRFELGKVERLAIRERVVFHFTQIDEAFAAEVARVVGVSLPVQGMVVDKAALGSAKNRSRTSPALSLARQPRESIRTRKIAVLAAPGVRGSDVEGAMRQLGGQGAVIEVISLALGPILSAEGRPIDVDKSLLTTSSVLYDAVFLPGGKASVHSLKEVPEVADFLAQAFRHAKPIAAAHEGIDLLHAASLPGLSKPKDARTKSTESRQGIVTTRGDDTEAFFDAFATAIQHHRHFDRGIFDKSAQKSAR
ncbi:MAG TPA: catalase [Planctomycetota bacterium]|nr:catalase [Planctomycetota bacterium]